MYGRILSILVGISIMAVIWEAIAFLGQRVISFATVLSHHRRGVEMWIAFWSEGQEKWQFSSRNLARCRLQEFYVREAALSSLTPKPLRSSLPLRLIHMAWKSLRIHSICHLLR